jgi:hypothetical protein
MYLEELKEWKRGQTKAILLAQMWPERVWLPGLHDEVMTISWSRLRVNMSRKWIFVFWDRLYLRGTEIVEWREKTQLCIVIITQWWWFISVRKKCSVSSRFGRTLFLVCNIFSPRIELSIFILQQTMEYCRKMRLLPWGVIEFLRKHDRNEKIGPGRH